jgi:hypothetical protein|tara:strand:- start:80 stop:901 length:822 start_codon:yes stop_codon:yes gene_type:complete
MNKENLKDLIKQVILENRSKSVLMEQVATEHQMAKRLFEQESQSGTGEFTEVAFNTMMATSVFMDGSLDEDQGEKTSHELEISLPSNPNQEVINRFYESLYSGPRSGFLSYYSKEELAVMHLYLVKGINAGFALKGGNDIVSVHNNSGIRGLGKFFMAEAKERGGTMLDHFDGFLSGLYRKNGFTNVYEVYQWSEQYKPKQWTYDNVDIYNPETSIYSVAMNELKAASKNPQDSLLNEEIEITAEDGFKIKINPNLKNNQYLYGRPDVIMRRL